MTDSVADFSAMLRRALGDRIAGEAPTFLEMLADGAVMEFPYAPPGLPERLDGKAAIGQHLASLADVIAFERMGEPIVHPTADPQTVILEFDGFGRGVATGEPYEQRYISVIRTHAGQIIHYRDYWNPLAVLRATKGRAVIKAITGSEVHNG
ncbi:hypothetical protein AcidC75_34360 [Acidisoma sp. C75]